MISQEAIAAFKERREKPNQPTKSAFGEEGGSRESLGKFHKQQHFWTCWRTEQFEQESLMGRK